MRKVELHLVSRIVYLGKKKKIYPRKSNLSPLIISLNYWGGGWEAHRKEINYMNKACSQLPPSSIN